MSEVPGGPGTPSAPGSPGLPGGPCRRTEGQKGAMLSWQVFKKRMKLIFLLSSSELICNTQIQQEHVYKFSDKGKILTLSPGSPTEPGGPEDPGGPVGP